MEIFAERLKELRADRGLSQDMLAKATGLSQTAINTWELNKKVPSALAVITLAKYFNVSADYLLGLEN